jgi:O-antigen ligase
MKTIKINSIFFNKEVNLLIGLFAFFLAFPSIYILGSSITFYIFLIIIARVGPFWLGNIYKKKLFVGFVFSIIISSIFAPYIEMTRHPGIFYVFKLFVQYIYWILITLFVIKFYDKINFYHVGKYFFYGTICSIIGFYFIDLKFDFLINFKSNLARNSFLFNILCCGPIIFYYLVKRYSLRFAFLFLILLVFACLFSQGRSGSIIIFIQSLFILILFYPLFSKFIKILFLLSILMYATFQIDSSNLVLQPIAEKIRPFNSRLADLIVSEGRGDLNVDKSWLVRRLMIDKSKEIFKKHPFFGVGINSFKYYDADLNVLRDYFVLSSNRTIYYNYRSSHNSYIQILSDFGLLGFSFFILIVYFPIYILIKNFFLNTLTIDHLPLVSFFGISLYFYTISAITGAIPWFIIGLSYSSIYKLRLNK